MNEDVKKILTDLVKDLINTDQGTIVALFILVDSLIKGGTLDKNILLSNIDEAARKFTADGSDPKFSNATIRLGNLIEPGRYPENQPMNLVEYLRNWNPGGDAH